MPLHVPRLRLHDTAGAATSPLPHGDGELSVFGCAPLPDTAPHIGHLTQFVGTDVLRRTLHWLGTPTRFLLAVPDIAAPAPAPTPTGGVPWAATAQAGAVRSRTEQNSAALHADLLAVGVLPPEQRPTSTSVGPVIDLVRSLEQAGFTYRLATGVYFDTGRLSEFEVFGDPGPELRALRAGAEPDPRRRHPDDFALWHLEDWRDLHAKRWASPWGPGRPGWHVGCSAVAATLGPTVGVHVGSESQRHHHHLAEIAQSEAVLPRGTRWVGHWMHHALLPTDSGALSRYRGAPSLASLRRSGFHPLAFRLLLLRSHYRARPSFTVEALSRAQGTLVRLAALARSARLPAPPGWAEARERTGEGPAAELLRRFTEALTDDLDTATALAVLEEALHEPHRDPGGFVASAADQVLGLQLSTADALVPTPG
ncbi:hypothetical protein CFP65_3084 [Kitasatospora sp. MMS16-BH015]|uniref:hypothetical protein n=1 Tax=Kitasatospora sp. MMS16-BH015 TaxID=2018025 RepID=UPI000CA3A562|nr:hypothetical protein [Kitasatospora sp. MMS16-BH015]AUG77891.1 hypothetical protein CFP65_3084 [Kitasatospora sp. MMS16-BH015]